MAAQRTDDRRDARASISSALAVALLWLGAIGGYALGVHGISAAFRSHLLSGLAMFCFLIIVPLLVVLLTLNWVARRIAGTIIILLFFVMAQGVIMQGFGLVAGTSIVFVCALLVGGMLFFLSRPAVMSATEDYYNFVSTSDVLSKYTFARKPKDA